MASLRSRPTGLGVLALLVILVGCGTGSATTTPRAGDGSAPRANRFAESVMAYGYGELVDGTPPWYEALDELLPTVSYALPDGTLVHASELVVVGRGVAIEAGRSGKDLGNDTWVESDFDDPDALSRTVHVVVEVDSAPGSSDPPVEVRVAFATSPDVTLEDAEVWFADAGRLVLFLTPSPVFAYDADLWGVVQNGAMVARVGSEGALTMPFTPGPVADRLLRRTPTLGALVAAAAEPRTIELVDHGGWYARR